MYGDIWGISLNVNHIVQEGRIFAHINPQYMSRLGFDDTALIKGIAKDWKELVPPIPRPLSHFVAHYKIADDWETLHARTVNDRDSYYKANCIVRDAQGNVIQYKSIPPEMDDYYRQSFDKYEANKKLFSLAKSDHDLETEISNLGIKVRNKAIAADKLATKEEEKSDKLRDSVFNAAFAKLPPNLQIHAKAMTELERICKEDDAVFRNEDIINMMAYHKDVLKYGD